MEEEGYQASKRVKIEGSKWILQRHVEFKREDIDLVQYIRSSELVCWGEKRRVKFGVDMKREDLSNASRKRKREDPSNAGTGGYRRCMNGGGGGGAHPNIPPIAVLNGPAQVQRVSYAQMVQQQPAQAAQPAPRIWPQFVHDPSRYPTYSHCKIQYFVKRGLTALEGSKVRDTAPQFGFHYLRFKNGGDEVVNPTERLRRGLPEFPYDVDEYENREKEVEKITGIEDAVPDCMVKGRENLRIDQWIKRDRYGYDDSVKKNTKMVQYHGFHEPYLRASIHGISKDQAVTHSDIQDKAGIPLSVTVQRRNYDRKPFLVGINLYLARVGNGYEILNCTKDGLVGDKNRVVEMYYSYAAQDWLPTEFEEGEFYVH